MGGNGGRRGAGCPDGKAGPGSGDHGAAKLWDQFAALLPERPAVDPTHPLGCHQPRGS